MLAIILQILIRSTTLNNSLGICPAYSKSHSELIKNFELLGRRTLCEPVVTIESLSCINDLKPVVLGGRLSWSTENLNKPDCEACQSGTPAREVTNSQQKCYKIIIML